MRARDYQPGEPVPGTVYKVLRLIGVGGMGTVYDVEDTTIGKRYVLKTLHPKLGDREDLARRIQNEARTLARLNHPNIVEVITAGVTADDLRLPYYLMERLSGQSLRVVLEKKGQLELSHAYHIGIDLLDALDHAHDKGVIHRDVKPDNIFLHRTVAGVTVTKLLDFGIVSMLDANQGETAGRFLGTLRYAAPEQLRGEKPTPKTDVYSAALVIYEIVAGRGPFDDQGEARRVAAAHMGKTAPPLSRFVPGTPRELDALLAAALAKSQDMRPRDAFSFAASLRNLRRKLEGSLPPESTENRVTASAVLAPESAPATLASVAPVPSRSSASTLSTLSKATLAGMPVPTLESPFAASTPFALATTTIPGPADWMAPTNTLGPDFHPNPAGETEAFRPLAPSGPPAPDDDPPEARVAVVEWPPEHPPVRSIEPQVRSLEPGALSRRGRRFPRAASIAAGTAGLGVVAVLSLHRPAPRPAAGAIQGAGVASVGSAPGQPGPVLTLPAPTIAPAWLPAEESAAPSVPEVTPSGAPPPAVPPPASRPHSPLAPRHGAPRPIAGATATATAPAVRPGPGF